MPDSTNFIINSLDFILEQGENNSDARVDLCASYDGGVTFSNYVPLILNPLGKRKNKCIFRSLGYSNEFTTKFKFWGEGRFVAQNGNLTFYQ
jgi:hypothetical protein